MVDFTPPNLGEPFKLGRALGSRVEWDTRVTVTAWGLIIPHNYKRRALYLIGPAAGTVTVSNDPAGVINNGITLSGTAGIVELYLEFAGDCVQKPWYGIGSAATAILAWIGVTDETP